MELQKEEINDVPPPGFLGFHTINKFFLSFLQVYHGVRKDDKGACLQEGHLKESSWSVKHALHRKCWLSGQGKGTASWCSSES